MVLAFKSTNSFIILNLLLGGVHMTNISLQLAFLISFILLKHNIFILSLISLRVVKSFSIMPLTLNLLLLKEITEE